MTTTIDSVTAAKLEIPVSQYPSMGRQFATQDAAWAYAEALQNPAPGVLFFAPVPAADRFNDAPGYALRVTDVRAGWHAYLSYPPNMGPCIPNIHRNRMAPYHPLATALKIPEKPLQMRLSGGKPQRNQRRAGQK